MKTSATALRRARSMILIAALGALVLSSAVATAQPAPSLAPLNPEFTEYQRDRALGHLVTRTPEGYRLGFRPPPFDRSHISEWNSRLLRPRVGFPAAFDLRTQVSPKLTPIRNQGAWGSCWAFATYASLESCLLPGELWDFSENHLKNTHGFDGADDPDRGGNDMMSTAYLARWSGPVDEMDDPYDDQSSTSPPGLLPQKHVQEVIWIATDPNEAKWAIYNYGALYCAYHHSFATAHFNATHSAYYYDGTQNANHAVAIVGWDDNYPAGNFSTTPPGNGAWIVRNSWGTTWGDAGYFYMSYHDTSLDFFVLFRNGELLDNYARVYQYDPLGLVSALGYGTAGVPIWAANVFTAAGPERLSAISFYATDSDGSYEAYVYRGVGATPTTGTIAATFSGNFARAGYMTVPLPTPADLNSGDTFSVVLKLTTSSHGYPAAVECAVAGYSSAATASPGQGYFGPDGSAWEDLTSFDATANFCIKAFTNDPPLHTVTITDGPAGNPNPVASGGDVACSVTAEDSHGHGLMYAWTAEGGAGSFNDASAQNPTWTAPANITDETVNYTITVTVTCAEDGTTQDTKDYQQGVLPAPHAVTITDGPQGDPNPAASGGEVACTVTAEDSHGHDLEYLWEATGGSFDDETAQNPTWTAPANITDETVNYTITVTVTCAEDGTTQDTKDYQQGVLPAPHAVTITDGPEGNPNPVASGGEVACTVTAEDSHAHELIYAWTATGGAFDNPATRTPTWTAPANLTEANVEYTISVTVTCAQNVNVHATDSYVQQVAPLTHAVTITDGPQGNPNPVASGGEVACTVTAEDSHGHELIYAWTATGGAFDDPSLPSPTWTAPANTTDATAQYTITVTVTCAEDAAVSATDSYDQQVSPVPHTIDITAGPRGEPNPVASGEDVQCFVDARDSRDGHTVQYDWTATAGDFDDPKAQNPIWTAPDNLTGQIADHTISVTASCADDPNVQATDSYTQQVEPLPHMVTIDPRPEGHPNPVPSGAEVVCAVNAHDSHGHDLNYEWMATGGSFDDPTAATPTWTAPVNTSEANVEYTISVTVTSAADASVSAFDSYQQQVQPVEHAVTITAGPQGDPNPVPSGGEVMCAVTAEDSREHDLEYEWTATGGAFDDPTSPTPTWTAPENATDEHAEHTITVTVTCAENGDLSDTASYTQQVAPVEHTVTITEGPEGAPDPVASGGEITLSVTAEDSRDGHDLMYEWTATGGSFDDPSAPNPTWTAPENPSDLTAQHTITVTVTCAMDATVQDTASCTQHVEPALHTVTVTAGPDGDPNPVASGGEVACAVTVEDSRGHELRYEWTATGGAFDDATAPNPTWTAPENTSDMTMNYTLTVTATCTHDPSVSDTASYMQQVEPVAHTVTITAGPEGDPSPVAAGGAVACTVSAEDSRDGHDLQYEWTATGGSFDDASAQNPTWTAPGEPGMYEISVTVTCAQDDTVSATASFIQEVRLHHTFPAGLQIIAVPLIPTDPDPAQLGFDAGRWARWNPHTGAYAVYPDTYTWFDPPHTVPGKGYWARYATLRAVSVAGETPPADEPHVVPIPTAGWVQIGNPRRGDVPWSITGAGALTVRSGGVTKTLAEARDAGWCDDFAWGFGPGVGYELVYDPGVALVVGRDRLEPWQGYWFRAHQPLELIFPSVATAAAAAARPPAERVEGDWSIPFIAALDDGSAAQAVVGQAAQVRGVDLPPTFGGVELSIVAGGRKLGVDLREHGGAPVWTLEAATSAADANVTLRWPDLSALPHDYRPVLVDLATGKRTYMRTSRGYTYTADAAGTRRFEVRMAPSGAEALALSSVTATAAGAGNVELRVTLSAAATLDAEVMNIAGRRVGTVCRGREMGAGTAVILWSATSETGTRLPGGRYLVRLTARADDGRQASVIAPLQLGR